MSRRAATKMYGALFWIVLFLLTTPCTLCCASRRLKFWLFFCGTPVVLPEDLEQQAAPTKATNAGALQNKKLLLPAAILVAVVLSYFAAALVTAVYISTAIDLFPGDSYENCGVSATSVVDGVTHCNWEYYPLIPPNTEEIKFKSADGATDLVGWWLNASTPTQPAVGAMLYHHGSGLNIAAEYREVRYDIYLQHGISVFTYDYPGYGKSNGKPSEESVNAASKGALAWLMARTGASTPSELLQLGRSLGGAVAIRLASDLGKEDKAFKGTIIQSAFSSYADATAAFFPTTAWAARSAVGPMFNSVSYVSNAKGCLFHYHGVADEWVPISQGEALQAAATGFTASCTPKMYTDEGVLHDAPMTDKLVTATFEWMHKDLGIPVVPTAASP